MSINSSCIELKKKIKSWEKSFFEKNGHKPSKKDIDCDPSGIKKYYKSYWIQVQSNDRITNVIKQKESNQVWGQELNKTKSTRPKKHSPTVKTFKNYSNKLLNHYMKENFANRSLYSELKKKVKKDKEKIEKTDNTLNDSDGIQSEEETSSIGLEQNSIELPFLDHQNGHDNVSNEEILYVHGIDENGVAIVSNCEMNPDQNIYVNQNDSIPQDQVSRFSLNSNITEDSISNSSNTFSNMMKNEAHGSSTFNSLVTSPLTVPTQKTLNSNNDNEIQQSIKDKVFNIIESLDVSDTSLNVNENSSFVSSYEQYPKSILKQPNTNTKMNPEPFSFSFIRSSLFANDKDDELEDLCLFESNALKRKDSSQDELKEMKKPDDVYEFVPEYEDLTLSKSSREVTFEFFNSENDYKSKSNPKTLKSVQKKLSVLEEMKQAVKSRSKKLNKRPQANYCKIDLKKKCFASRGFKRFNAKNYKRSQWKKLQKIKSNTCFKCGKEGHWANTCLAKIDFSDVVEEEDDYGLLEADVTNIRPTADSLLPEENDYSEILLQGLEELGFKEFRKNQQVTIERILNAKSTLFISSTGSGKSLCYQLPAYLFWKLKGYVTLVISPLISLMEDQLETLPKKMKAVCLHSSMKSQQKDFALSCLQNGMVQILLISPESIVTGTFTHQLSQLPAIAFACIDEAHCLSEWSNNFRPSYLQVHNVLKEKFKVKTFLALTATATVKTCSQILRNLGLSKDDVIGETKIPENLILSASRDINKDTALIDLLKSPRFIDLESIIIYCSRRETTERIATLIRITMQDVRSNKVSKNGLVWDASVYHAGLTPEERKKVQKRFSKGDLRVIVATIAFGMGINKSNIRGVIHYNLPRSFESYVQEIGRAGRDNKLAYCHILLDSDGSDFFELQRYIFANSADRFRLRKLLEKIFKPCKCSIFHDDNVTNENNCPGHEIALSFKELTYDLDLKEEVILTIICFIELNYPQVQLKLLPSVNCKCKILCYSGSEQVQDVAKKCPAVGLALALSKRQNKTIANILEFNYVDMASMLGQDSLEVRRALKQLEWQTINTKSKRTNIRVDFSELALRLKAPGNLNDSQLDCLLEFLNNYITSQETIELNKLKYVYSLFHENSQTKCTNKLNITKSDKLKSSLNDYFSIDNIPKEFDLEHCIMNHIKCESIKCPIFDDHFKNISLSLCNIEQARRDIRELISTHMDQNLSARGMAQILQGIPSPRYPVEVWGKVKRFWRCNINIEFSTLVLLAKEELLKMRSITID